MEKVKWRDEVIVSFAAACRAELTPAALIEVERKVRAGTGSRCNAHQHYQTSECSHPKQHRFKQHPGDSLGEILDNTIDDANFPQLFAKTAERAAMVFNRLKKKIEADGTIIYTEDELKLKKEILKKSLTMEIEHVASQKWTEQHYARSKDPAFLAIPNPYKGKLNSLEGKTIKDLMERGFAVQDDYINDPDMLTKVYDEIELLEFSGKFEEVSPLRSTRSDQICWQSLSDLDRSEQRALHHLFGKMSTIPYELNEKAKLAVQIASLYQLSYFSSQNTFYKIHMDNGLKKGIDNGLKITCMYFPNSPTRKEKDGGVLRIYERQSQAKQEQEGFDMDKVDKSVYYDLVPKGDRLLIMRTREIPYEVLTNFSKQFSVSMWLPGPAGPGDNLLK